MVLNKKIVQVDVFEKKSFICDKERILNKKVVQLRRRGKALIFDFEGGESFLIHLRMTGQMVVVGKQERFAGGHPNESFIADLPNKQTRVRFLFDDGSEMFFNDQRKFGFIKVLKTDEIEEDEFVKKLGKEPWEMSTKELFEKLKKKNVCVKTALLDQTVMAGLGNIYVDETLYFAGISPKRKCADLSEEEVEKLIFGARKTMEDSLKAGGSTIKNYVKADGTRGDYLDLFAKIYGREGKICEKCGGKISKIKVGGRGTHYCKECQK